MFVDATITLAIVLYKLSPHLAQFKFLHNVLSTGVVELATEWCPGILPTYLLTVQAHS
jgi:hypothetical protein